MAAQDQVEIEEKKEKLVPSVIGGSVPKVYPKKILGKKVRKQKEGAKGGGGGKGPEHSRMSSARSILWLC